MPPRVANHIRPESSWDRAMTFEGQVVRISDIFAYVNHDLDDALRAGFVKKTDIPKKILGVLGNSHAQRIDTMVRDLIFLSQKNGMKNLAVSDQVLSATYALRDFLYAEVYESIRIKNEFKKAKKVLRDLYGYYLEHIEEVFVNVPKGEKPNKHRLVCDFIAGMTDRFALMTYERLFLPQQWTVL